MADSPIYLNLVGTKGRIYVEEFLGAKRAIVSPRGKQAYTVDADYGSDNGFEHEVKEVMACVVAGKKESAIMPLSRSIDIMNLMDTVRWQNGLHYEIEK